MSTIKGDHYPACATWFGEECDCDAWKEAPVRDIREAMHPVSDRPLWTPPLLNSDGSMRAPYVATLPDGSRVNLPAGTVLREDVDRCIGCGGTGRVETPEDGPEKCHDCYGDGRESTARLDLARDLLQRARIRLVDEPDAKKLDAEIVAFLAGASPPEPSARVALVLLMARILRESFAEGRTVKETVGDITEDMNAAIDLAFPELARHLAPSPK